jgi:hypothetical protein
VPYRQDINIETEGQSVSCAEGHSSFSFSASGLTNVQQGQSQNTGVSYQAFQASLTNQESQRVTWCLRIVFVLGDIASDLPSDPNLYEVQGVHGYITCRIAFTTSWYRVYRPPSRRRSRSTNASLITLRIRLIMPILSDESRVDRSLLVVVAHDFVAPHTPLLNHRRHSAR